MQFELTEQVVKAHGQIAHVCKSSLQVEKHLGQINLELEVL